MSKLDILGIVDQVQRHADRLQWAKDQLEKQAPFTEQNIKTQDDINRAIIDQFIFRFAKLQDAMGAQLFPAILELTAEPGPLNTFIDKLNRLEKIGALESAEEWLSLREMRNLISHEYPDDPGMQAATLNKALKQAEPLLQITSSLWVFLKPYLPKN